MKKFLFKNDNIRFFYNDYIFFGFKVISNFPQKTTLSPKIFIKKFT